MGNLSFMHLYLGSLIICVITGWVIQFFDSSDEGYGFGVAVFILGLLPVANIGVAAISLLSLVVLILGLIASLPRIIRSCRK